MTSTEDKIMKEIHEIFIKYNTQGFWVFNDKKDGKTQIGAYDVTEEGVFHIMEHLAKDYKIDKFMNVVRTNF